MGFLAPLWLWTLAPWALVVAWMFVGIRPRADVPFLKLWRGPVQGPRDKRSISSPPLAVILALAAICLAIVAAARPAVRSVGGARPVTIIVDRGITMSARGKHDARWRELVSESAEPIAHAFGSGTVNLISVPGMSSVQTDRSGWRSVRDEPSSSLDTQSLIRNATAQASASFGDPVLVLTDQNLSTRDPRVVQISPPSRPQNVDIVALAARAGPHPQVMITVRNQSNLPRTRLSVRSGGSVESRQVDLPAEGSERNEFIDLPALSEQTEVAIEASDDLPADNTAWLVRQRRWPTVESRTPLPESLGRMVSVYQKHRTPDGGSTRIVLASDPSQLTPGEPGVILASPTSSSAPLGDKPRAANHPIVAGVDWKDALRGATFTGAALPTGWQTVLSSGTQPLIAVRDSPARQVWLLFDAPQMSRTPEFVIFWTNVFGWLGSASGDAYGWRAVTELGSEWKRVSASAAAPSGSLQPSPGIYARSDGARQALNALDVKFDDPPAANWRQILADRPAIGVRRTDLSPAAYVLSIALLGLSALSAGAHKPLASVDI